MRFIFFISSVSSHQNQFENLKLKFYQSFASKRTKNKKINEFLHTNLDSNTALLEKKKKHPTKIPFFIYF